MIFKDFAAEHASWLYSSLEKAFRNLQLARVTIVAYPSSGWDASTIYLSFFAECEKVSSFLKEKQIEIICKNGKYALLFNMEKVLLRIGKMDSSGHMKKVSTGIDKQLASQDLSLFQKDDFTVYNFGYTLSDDGLSIKDCIFAYPISPTQNKEIFYYSLKDIPDLFPNDNGATSTATGNGFKAKLKKRTKKEENQG